MSKTLTFKNFIMCSFPPPKSKGLCHCLHTIIYKQNLVLDQVFDMHINCRQRSHIHIKIVSCPTWVSH